MDRVYSVTRASEANMPYESSMGWNWQMQLVFSKAANGTPAAWWKRAAVDNALLAQSEFLQYTRCTMLPEFDLRPILPRKFKRVEIRVQVRPSACVHGDLCAGPFVRSSLLLHAGDPCADLFAGKTSVYVHGSPCARAALCLRAWRSVCKSGPVLACMEICEQRSGPMLVCMEIRVQNCLQEQPCACLHGDLCGALCLCATIYRTPCAGSCDMRPFTCVLEVRVQASCFCATIYRFGCSAYNA
eukprot:1147379-Pelagomonas_calceolata.AAC.5